jgi:phage terminase large subunit
MLIQTAKVFKGLQGPSRWKGAFGGRGSGKSHFFADRLLQDSQAEKGLLSVCLREVQKSLKDSAKRLIERKLIAHNLGEKDGFKVYEDKIKTPGDGIIIFQGLADQTAEAIKSLEGFKRAWLIEGQTITHRSLSILKPTIREKDSEIWIDWNPRRKTDPVDIMFRGEEKPTGALIVRSNWDNNPWFPAELEQERQDCLRMEPDQYDHIWEGDYITVSAGAYYAKQLALARSENRICHLVREPLLKVWAFWDIGGSGAKADATAIWIVQFVGKEVRFLDYYEAQGQPLLTHLLWMQQKGYSDAECVLPHDARQGDKVYSVSYESEIRKAQFSVRVIDNQGAGAASARVEALRKLFPQCWFDIVKCSAGLDCLGWYHAKIDEKRGIDLGPEHDFSSHASDSAGMVAVCKEILDKQTRKPQRQYEPVGSWME